MDSIVKQQPVFLFLDVIISMFVFFADFSALLPGNRKNGGGGRMKLSTILWIICGVIWLLLAIGFVGLMIYNRIRNRRKWHGWKHGLHARGGLHTRQNTTKMIIFSINYFPFFNSHTSFYISRIEKQTKQAPSILLPVLPTRYHSLQEAKEARSWQST